MKIKTVEVRDTIQLLVDPQPSFMALVDHGANQTPFAVVKRVGKPVNKEQETMAIKGKGSKAPASKLTKMQFSKTEFKTEKSVTDFLEENSIGAAGAVEDGDDVWVVNSTEDLSAVKLGKSRSTGTKHTGVTAFIAPVIDGPEDEEDDDGEAAVAAKAGDNPPEDDEDDGEEIDEEDDDTSATKGASKVKLVDGEKTSKVRKPPAPKKAATEPTTIEPLLQLSSKFDFWGAYTSEGDGIMAVIDDGMDYDNAPPGLEEVFMSMMVATGNILGGVNEGGTVAEKLGQLGQEFAGIALGLHNLFNGAEDDSTSAVQLKKRKAAKDFLDSFKASIERVGKGDVSGFANVDNGVIEPKTETKEADPDAIAKAVGEAVGKQLAPLIARQEQVEKELRRAPTSKSMSESIGELVEDEEDEDEDEAIRKARFEEIRRSLGLRPATA